MVPIVHRSNKKKRGSQIVLKLGNGAHLHLETTKQKRKKRKKGGAKTPPLPRLSDGAHMCLEEKKIKKRKKKGSSSFSFVETWTWSPKRGNNKKMKKRGASSFSTESW